jgi:peptide/nickel transport system permease protein
MVMRNAGSAVTPGAADSAETPDLRPRQSVGRRIGSFCRSKPLGAVSAAIVILTVFAAMLAPVVAPYDPLEQEWVKFTPPTTENLLGTDQLGRDVLSRIIYGARVSMYVGIISVLVGISAGTLVGIVSAYFGGIVDLVVQRLVDALMGFPPVILALALMAALGGSVNNVIIALVVVLLPGAIRVIRSQVLSIKELDYVLAAQAIGARPLRVMLRHILPNVLASYIVLGTITLGFAIIIEASLSFLGVGVSPDVPTWGSMLSDGANRYIRDAPWLAVFPGLAISIVVFAINFLGDALRDVLDPRLRSG